MEVYDSPRLGDLIKDKGLPANCRRKLRDSKRQALVALWRQNKHYDCSTLAIAPTVHITWALPNTKARINVCVKTVLLYLSYKSHRNNIPCRQ